MSSVQLQLPILVQNIKVDERWQYYIRPLFFQSPIATDRRYEAALQQFRKELRAYFRDFKLRRDNMEQLFWFRFSPKMQSFKPQLKFLLEKEQLFQGRFHILYFQLQEQGIVCLPSFQSYCFLVDAERQKPSDILAQTKEVIEELLLMELEEGSSLEELQQFCLQRSEFVQELQMRISLEQGDFSFEATAGSDMMAFFQAPTSFDGADELERLGRNLNNFYPSELQRAFEREELIKELYPLVYGPNNQPLVLIGEAGVGRHSLIEEMVYRYMQKGEEELPEEEEIIWRLDPIRVISGMSIVGMWQKRMEAIVEELRSPKGYRNKQLSHKLVIDNPLALVRIGKTAQNSMTLADLLKPYLEQQAFQLILIANSEEWKLLQEKDRRFTELFQLKRIPAAKEEEAARMLLGLRKELELQEACSISVPALQQMLNIHHNYFKKRALPGSVAKMMRQLARKLQGQSIDVEEVQEEFKEYTGLASPILDDNYQLEAEELRKNISARLIGQEQAVERLSQLIHLLKAKLQNPNRPLASFLFIGPTGVGKTEAAKVICDYLTGDPKQLIRFDMNEYNDYNASSRLLGSYNQPEGQLGAKLRYNPFGILLFDEIEKAHPLVHDLLLQVLDDGRLSDALGRPIDFSNTIIIMTSNIGAEDLDRRLGFGNSPDEQAAIYRRAVENFFRPELINRIEEIVIFNSLELPHILQIAQLQIKQLLSRDGFVRRTSILNISAAALEWVANRGYSKRMGGRALKRQIERDLTAFTAEELLKTTGEQPVIFDIQLKEDKLQARIEELRFIQRLEQSGLPNMQQQKGPYAYKDLLRKVEQMQGLLRESQEEESHFYSSQPAQEQWHFFQLKEQLEQSKERLQHLLLEFKSLRLEVTPLRLKNSGTRSLLYQKAAASQEQLKQEAVFEDAALAELRYVYQNAPDQFDRSQSLYLQQLLKVTYLSMACRLALQEETDAICLHFESAIEGQGQKEIDYLQTNYARLLEYLDLNYRMQPQKIWVEGYALYDLFKKEEGYHLFYRPQQTALPIRLRIQFQEEPLSSSPLEIIRLYDIWMGEEQARSTLTDLRTAYTNQAQISPEELAVLLYIALDPSDKQLYI